MYKSPELLVEHARLFIVGSKGNKILSNVFKIMVQMLKNYFVIRAAMSKNCPHESIF